MSALNALSPDGLLDLLSEEDFDAPRFGELLEALGEHQNPTVEQRLRMKRIFEAKMAELLARFLVRYEILGAFEIRVDVSKASIH